MEHQDLNDMAIFAEIAATGGITAAAEKTKLPKSNVSRRLARLEARLGVKLMERNTRVSKVTPIGLRYADFCRQMLEDARAADDIVQRNLDAPTGELHISTSVLLGQQVMPPVIARFAKQYPEVKIALSLSNRRSNLIEDGFDLAFRIGDLDDSGLIAQSLGRFPMHLYASKIYLRTAPPLAGPDDLIRHRCLVMSNSENWSGWVLQNADGISCKCASPSIAANDFLTLKNLSLADAGITMLPEYAVQSESTSARLVRVLDGWHGQSAELSAVYPSRRGATAKVREFIRCAREHLNC
jgi:DNA-binding transcriptional LysR family regulator